VGQELTAPALALADHRVRPHRRRHRQGDDDRQRREEIHRERVRRLRRSGVTLHARPELLGQAPHHAAQLLHEPNIRHVGDDREQHRRDHHEEQAAITANGTQKSRAWRSWRRSVRAMTSARDRPADRLTNPAPGS
jgi:chromosome condensin MukBEF MukE localization factor